MIVCMFLAWVGSFESARSHEKIARYVGVIGDSTYAEEQGRFKRRKTR